MARGALFLFFFYFLSLLHHGGGAAAAEGDSSTDFIRESCKSTLYPDLCFSSLVRYAASVGKDPVQLARAAAAVSKSQLANVVAHVAALPLESAAVRQCAEVLRMAADQARQSEAELGRLETAEGAEVAWMVSNAQTWLSAAITNEVTCVDGFGLPAAVPATVAVGDDVCGRVRWAQQFSSNALTLVNRLVAGR